MKLLPCPSPECRARGAMLPPSPAYPRGEPALTGQYTASVTCARCGTTTPITPADYSRIPSVTIGDFARLAREYGVADLKVMPIKDLVGAGLEEAHAEQMFNAGFLTAEDPDRETGVPRTRD